MHRLAHAAPALCRLVTPAPRVRASTSFIEKAKLSGAQSLLGAFTHLSGRFDHSMRGLQIKRIGDGEVECEIAVDEHLTNAYGTLHGGAVSTLVDIVGTLALLSRDPTRAGVSVEINTTFVAAAKAGADVTVTGRVLKAGKRLGFTQVDLIVGEQQLVATGRHTKAL